MKPVLAFGSLIKMGCWTAIARTSRTNKSLTPEPSNEIGAWPRNQHGQVGLAEVISKIDATVLIGLSTVKGIFTEPIVRDMARKTERPIIFPLSNPTSRSEAEPADLLAWTEGRALVATGSPFPAVKYGGKSIEIAQCNNVFIFPAVGLGLLSSQARRVTDKMMLAGAKALGDHSPAIRDPAASLLPNIKTIREIALEIANAVALKAQEEGLAPAWNLQPSARRLSKANGSPNT